MKIVITNPAGATLRSGPSKSGGTIRKINNGEVLPVEFLLPADQTTGDQWVKLEGLFPVGSANVSGYCAVKVNNQIFGVVVEVEPPDGQDDPKRLVRTEIAVIQSFIEERYRKYL
jgi:hypothetical protein